MPSQQNFKFVLLNEDLKKLLNAADPTKHWELSLSVDEESKVTISVNVLNDATTQVSAYPNPPYKV